MEGERRRNSDAAAVAVGMAKRVSLRWRDRNPVALRERRGGRGRLRNLDSSESVRQERNAANVYHILNPGGMSDRSLAVGSCPPPVPGGGKSAETPTSFPSSQVFPRHFHRPYLLSKCVFLVARKLPFRPAAARINNACVRPPT